MCMYVCVFKIVVKDLMASRRLSFNCMHMYINTYILVHMFVYVHVYVGLPSVWHSFVVPIKDEFCGW